MEKTGIVCKILSKNDKSNTKNNIEDWGIKQLEDYKDSSLDGDYSTSYWLITTGEISKETKN